MKAKTPTTHSTLSKSLLIAVVTLTIILSEGQVVSGVIVGTFGVCYSQQDGTVFPIAGTCDEYIYCLSQQQIRLYCPVGQIFSKSLRGCVTNEAEICNVHGPTVPPIDFNAKSTCVDNEESSENQMQCKGQPFGELVPYPNDCSRFLVCDCLFPTVQNCLNNLWFNNQTKMCDTSENVICQTTTATTTATTIFTTLSTSTLTVTPSMATKKSDMTTTVFSTICKSPPGIADTECENSADGTLYRYPYDCTAYINCTLGCPVLNYCEKNKVFYELLKICDTPDVAHCEDLPLTTALTSTTGIDISTTISSTLSTDCEIYPSVCSQHSDNYLLPVADNCSEFIRCFEHEPHRHKCPDSLLFNPVLLICDNADDVHYCGSQLTTTTTDDTDHTATETSASTVVYENCVGAEHGTTFPYVTNCQLYYYCWGNDTFSLLPCPKNNWYNPNTGNCGPNVSPNACQEITITTTPMTTTERTTLSPEELCSNSDVGDTYPIETDCQQYILCLGNGNARIVKCPSNNWFNPKTGNCGPNVSQTACKGSSVETTTDTTSTSTPSHSSTSATESSTPPQNSLVCQNQINGEIFAYPGNCSKYIVCSTPAPIAFNCQSGYYFSSLKNQCVLFAESDCEQSSITTSSTAAPQEPTICTNTDRDTFPYLENCNWYLRCVNDYVYMMEICNKDNYYDPVTGGCREDVSSSACKENYNQNTTTTSTSTEFPLSTTTENTTPPPKLGPCAGIPDGTLVPYPNDCTKYIHCQSPIPMGYDCDPGLEFNAQFQRCLSPEYANCTTIITTPKPDESNTQNPINVCAGQPDLATHPYVNDCSLYIVCIEQSEIIVKCKQNMYYDVSQGQCVENSSATACREEYSTTTNSTAQTPISPTESSPTTTTPGNDVICAGKQEGSLVPYPNNCSKYIVCSLPIPVGHDCPPNLEFNAKESKCMDSNLANCGQVTTSTKPSATPTITTVSSIPTTTTTVSSFTPNLCCGQMLGTLLPYPDNCNKYIVCAYPIPYTVDCSSGFVFDAQTNKCVEEQDTHVCAKTQQLRKPPIVDAAQSCNGVVPGTPVQYIGDCTRYMLCFGDQSAVLECGSNWYFNPTKKECVPTSMYRCPWQTLL